MRFFKAFNILHRRTKSATFVPGVAPNTIDFASAAPTNVRSASFSLGLGCRNPASLSLFDLVTDNPPPVPSNFSHLNHSPQDRVLLGLWRPRRFSDRNSLASLQSSMNKECGRLSKAINFWILEYTKIQNLLRNCQEELKAERLKTALLERELEQEGREKAEMGMALERYEKFPGDSRNEGFSGQSLTSLPSQRNQIILYPRERLSRISSASNTVTLGESSRPRTLDEYSSALRMTLLTRKELRDQKKVTKFWKNLAVVGGQPNAITPSVSAISSIREVMSEDRQAAVQALISRRGMSDKMKINDNSSTTLDNVTTETEDVVEVISHGASNTLISSLSNSGFSRLGPLASESMKQEVNLLFGSASSAKRLASPRSRRNGSLDVSKSTSFKGGLSGNTNLSLNIESFDDISAIFQRAFGIDTARPRHGTADQTNSNTDCTLLDCGLPNSRKEIMIASSSSSCLPDSSMTSSYSQVWVNVESVHETESATSDGLRPMVNGSCHTLKLASKECTSRRSWQRYVAKSTVSDRNSSGGQSPQKDAAVRCPAGGKENSGFSMSLPAFRRKNSRLPIPVMKNAR